MNYLTMLAEELSLSIEVVGSFASGLWVRQSNIDVQLVRVEKLENPPKVTLETIAQQLEDHHICKATLKTYSNGGCKLRCEIKCSKALRIVHLNICYPNSPAQAIALYLKNSVQAYPDLVPLFFVLKALVNSYKLNEGKAGIRTNALAVMLLSCISTWNRVSLGKFLIDFLYCFGFYYDYQWIGNEEAIEDDSLAIQIVDPISHTPDLGRAVVT